MNMAQHWVPQYVLRGVSPDGIHVCQYDKTGKIAPKMVPVKVACGRKDAFSAPVERLLATIENAANPAIDVFRSMEHPMRIDPVAKRIVAVYLNTFLWKRSPAIRDKQVAETSEAELLGWAHDAAERYGTPPAYRDLLPVAVAKAASDVNGLMAEHWESSTFQRWLFCSMSWAVLRCADPIVTVPDRGLVQLGGRGLLDPKVEFYFPLNAKRVLVASWRGSPSSVVQILSASPAHMRGINKHGFGQAGRFVYGLKPSEKVATAVQKPSHHFPSLRALPVAGGDNPTAAKLDSLKTWYEKVVADSSDHPDRHWCIAPGARYQCRHSWQRTPFELPAIKDMPETKAQIGVCEWCSAVKWRFPNGHVRFDDLELRRTTVSEAMKNWWQSFRIVGSGTRIEARGAMPRYRVAD